MNPIHPPIRLAALISLSFALHPASSYQLVDLGPGTANAVNSSGRIVGNGPTGAWTHDGTNALLDEAGAYRVVVSNGAGSVTSSVARVEIKVRPELSLLNYAGISVRGVVGKTYRIEAADAPAGEWQSVKTLTLKTSPTLWFDEESPSRNRRVYRVVEVP